jgi:hypothetical protein
MTRSEQPTGTTSAKCLPAQQIALSRHPEDYLNKTHRDASLLAQQTAERTGVDAAKLQAD